MNLFPFDSLVAANRELGLVAAVAIGFGMGFVLERAGFGRANKLAGQFYLYDMTVFKVMFTAIVTAMLGLMVAAGLGLADLRAISESIVSWTYIWPMLVGGFVLGIGFIISAYCPGTSAVSMASGNVDGLFAFVGVVAGTFVYSELQQIAAFEAFHNSGDKGPLFLYDVLGISPQLLAVIITVVAVGCFIGAEKVETMFRRKYYGAEESVPVRAPRRVAFATLATLGVIAIATLAVPAQQSIAAEPARTLSVQEFAERLIGSPWTMRVIDTRSAEAFAKAAIPGSENVEPKMLADLGLEYAEPTATLVIVNGATPSIPEAATKYRGEIVALAGGFDAWKRYALDPPGAPAPTASKAELEAYAARSALHSAMTGQAAAAPIVAAAPKGGIVKPKKKGGGCSS
ncbi:MAG: YeeE/YedE thiosulfate transporter family protein [Thermoanaerobaculia bacterium]